MAMSNFDLFIRQTKDKGRRGTSASSSFSHPTRDSSLHFRFVFLSSSFDFSLILFLIIRSPGKGFYANDSEFGLRLKCFFVESIASSERVTAMNSVSVVTFRFHVASECFDINHCRINVKRFVTCMRVSRQAMHDLWMPVTDT